MSMISGVWLYCLFSPVFFFPRFFYLFFCGLAYKPVDGFGGWHQGKNMISEDHWSYFLMPYFRCIYYTDSHWHGYVLTKMYELQTLKVIASLQPRFLLPQWFGYPTGHNSITLMAFIQYVMLKDSIIQ